MTTFAENVITLPDGQQTSMPCPEEITLRGFFPPVQAPNGQVIRGDVLPSSWLNDLLRKAYRQMGTIKPPASIPDNFETPGTTDGVQGYFTIDIGDITLEIGAYRRATTTPAQGFIAFKGVYKFGYTPHLYMLDLSDPTTNAGKYGLWSSLSGGNSLQANIAAKPLVRADTSVLPGTFFYMVIGQKAISAPVGQVPSLPIFCSEPQNFIDGQTSFAAPSAEQQSFGFAPPILTNNQIREGDTLPANVLNYLLHDIMANQAGIYWERTDDSVLVRTAYRLIIGDMQLQSVRNDITTADPNVVSFTWPFASTATDSDIFMMANACTTSFACYAAAQPLSPTQFNAVIRRIDVANAAAAIAGVANILAIGPAPANAVRPKSLVPALPSFAAQDRTYPDGQANRVKPSDLIMSQGFSPPYKDLAGLLTVGDFVTANELNWLFNDIYKQLGTNRITTGKIAANTTTKVTGGGWVAIGSTLIQWYTVKGLVAGDWPSNVRTQLNPLPFKGGSKPAYYVVDSGISATSCLLTTVSDQNDNTLLKAGAFRLTDGAAATVNGFRVLAIGKKP